MGAWGAGLYQDDEASDVRDMISLLSQMPRDGDWILDTLLRQFEREIDLSADGAPTFWMAVGDQFAKRGISSEVAFAQAYEAIRSGADLDDLRARGMEAVDLRRREKSYEKLLARLSDPKDPRTRRTRKSPPSQEVKVGEIYCFPTMQGVGFNAWFSTWQQANFVPDGWGAMVILAVGRELEWFPWAAFVSMVLDDFATKPTFKVARASRTFDHLSIMHCLPRKTHMKRMGLELLGEVKLYQKAVKRELAKARYSPNQAVLNNWSISSGAIGKDHPVWQKLEAGVLIESRS